MKQKGKQQMDFEDDEGLPDFAMQNADDINILMHRDVHFNGEFPVMIAYYQKEGKGVNPAFELSRIEELAHLEKEGKQNLAGLLLSGAQAEKVRKAKECYKALKALYEISKPSNKNPRLIADLIFAEEENPEAEIAAIVAEKATIVPLLIDLLRSEDFHDPLFPGYGQAPSLAARCLGLIGDKRAIISLYESIGESDFFSEDDVLDALKRIGQPAKDFLLKVLHARPLTFDNERAATALVSFREDPEVAKICLNMLLQPETWKDPILSTHLILTCEGLKDKEERQNFSALAENPTFPKNLKLDVTTISKGWQ